MDYKTLITRQRDFFATGATLPVSFRLEQLALLRSLIKQYEGEIVDALYQDLNKPRTESLLSEIMMLTDDIRYISKNLKKWTRAHTTITPFPLLWPGKSTICHEPYGVSLIIGPWNFPFMLTMQPLVGAISAGNCAIIKPSEITPATEKMIMRIINEHFPSEYLHVVHADIEQTQQLLAEQFDYIFFTGSERVGKIIMESAAQHLTPVTLELGGKSPCLVDETADLQYAAKHIMWAKTMNAGQVCVAPDYLYVHRSRKDELISHLRAVIQKFYGDDPSQSDSYGRIINAESVKRLEKLLKNGRILCGGQVDEAARYIAPTLIDDVTWDDPIMREEIFGPLLPILTYDHIDEVIQQLRSRPKPLAMYLFTRDSQVEEKIIRQLSFGAGSINDCIMQIANTHLPFGGVGQSGMGQYHGRFSFEVFSHRKGIYKKNPLIDITLHHPPHTDRKLKWIRRLLRF